MTFLQVLRPFKLVNQSVFRKTGSMLMANLLGIKHANSGQADICQNVLLLINFLLDKAPFYPIIQAVVKQNHFSVLTLSQTANFRPFEIESVCRRQFLIWWKWQKVLQTARKHCGKRRNCSLRVISPFPIVFSKDLYCRLIKTRACLGKG